jgi:2-keto-4-pentenoate hydratase/2-oxohepta-3-ene-1,7-dioic acid hydratase in catechol pathway
VRFALFNGDRLGLLRGEEIVDVSGLVDRGLVYEPSSAMLGLIRTWPEVSAKLDGEALNGLPAAPLDEVDLGPPLPTPGKIVAAPINYLDHKEEMRVKGTVAQLGMFLKANSSVIGTGGVVEMPYQDRRVDQEGELAVVIGRTARRVSAEDALDYVFGYTCLLDISVRGQEDRSTRKSFDTFTPMGPWIVTGEEVGDPGGLELRCWVNQELRQHASTKDLIYGVPELVEYASSVMTLYPGDIVSTGTPAGVGPLADGDRVIVEIERVGRLWVRVSDKHATKSPVSG